MNELGKPDLRRTPLGFVPTSDVRAVAREAEHGGFGPIAFRRLLASADFEACVDFVDFTVVPAGSTIGRHRHDGTEELYFIAKGTPLVAVDGDRRRLAEFDLAVVRSGQTHELINDTDSDVAIFVVQVRI
jgi:mannose-6-phosphate isomerase-like protein (cupin superfamily)